MFMDEDSITFIYSARDLVENYGVSSKTISYKIIDPLEKTIVSTPSNSGEILFEEGSVSEITAVIAEDLIINSKLQKSEINIFREIINTLQISSFFPEQKESNLS